MSTEKVHECKYFTFFLSVTTLVHRLGLGDKPHICLSDTEPPKAISSNHRFTFSKSYFTGHLLMMSRLNY